MGPSSHTPDHKPHDHGREANAFHNGLRSTEVGCSRRNGDDSHAAFCACFERLSFIFKITLRECMELTGYPWTTSIRARSCKTAVAFVGVLNGTLALAVRVGNLPSHEDGSLEIDSHGLG